MVKPLIHLLDWVEPIANSEDSKRLEFIYSEHWIGYSRARAGVEKLEFLFNFPKRQRMPNLLIIGQTNNGKSKMVERFYRRHMPVSFKGEMVPDRYGLYEKAPVVYVQMPPHPDVKRFYTILLNFFGFEVRASLRTATLESAVLSRLGKIQPTMLIIDEIHNILSGRNQQQREFLNVLRFLGNELQIPIVAIGTHEAYLAIRSDEQLENRFDPFLLLPWEEDQEYYSLLASYEALLPLRKQSSLTDPVVARKILDRTEGVLGEIVTLLSKAAEKAIASGEECINEALLDETSYNSPTERRKIMERALV